MIINSAGGDTENSAANRAASRAASRRRRVLRAASVVLLVGLAVVTAVRALGHPSWILVAVAALAPLAGLCYLLPLGLAGLARAKIPAAVSVLGVLVHGAWAAPLFVADDAYTANARESGRSDRPDGLRGLTVLSVNMEYGRADPAEIVRLVREREVDLLSIQELTTAAIPKLRSAGLDRLLPHSFAVPGPPAPAGSGIWSRYPLTGGKRLEPARFRNLAAVANIDGQEVTVVAAHPFPPIGSDGHELWKRDYATLETGLAALGGPVIVAGDFNATHDHGPFRRLLRLGYADAAETAGAGLVLTWPAAGALPPFMSLDHILVRSDAAVPVTGFEKVRIPGTDHFAVIAALGK